MQRFFRSERWILAGVLVVVSSLGCSGTNASQSKYVPSAGTARESLVAALAAWQRGDPPGKIASANPAIEVVDSKRGEQKLVSYEIVREETGDGNHWFTVRLNLGPGGSQEARFAVVGRDPIWVFRDADYSQSGGM